MGDAGEMLVAAELTLHGIPASRLPENWPHYDLIAQPPDDWAGFSGVTRPPQTISVKTRTFARSGNFVGYHNDDEFDWLAIVILPGEALKIRRIFIIPRAVVRARSYEALHRNGRGFFVHRLVERPALPFLAGQSVPNGGWGLGDYENNFTLRVEPAT
jgi:hypothetical protein